MLKTLARWLSLVALATACSTTPFQPGANGTPPVSPSPMPTAYNSAPISAIAVDEFASGATLTVPPGTQFGLELGGGGWDFHLPESDDFYRLVSGPGPWDPDLGFAGSGNCDSASPCGGEGIVFQATTAGYSEVPASIRGYYAFDLHLQVRAGAAIMLDMPAVPIINEALSTLVTAPVGAIVNVHLIGNWGQPKPNETVLKLFREEHMSTTGVVTLVAVSSILNETIYSYRISGKGGYQYDFDYLDPSPFASGYEIAFDIR